MKVCATRCRHSRNRAIHSACRGAGRQGRATVMQALKAEEEISRGGREGKGIPTEERV